ncbi:MAG: hypothetical protein WC438_02575 [Candidatus Pacearchaeota archaeon]
MHTNKIKTIILSLTIAIVLSAFVVYSIQTIYHKPEYDEFCKDIKPIYPMENITQQICEANNGKWNPQNIQCIKAPCIQGYCDFYYQCQQEQEAAFNKYKLVVFIISLIVGLIALALGIILKLPSVSSGLMLGGTFLIFYGTIVYWTNLTNLLRTIILGLALIVLIWLGYKKLKN